MQFRRTALALALGLSFASAQAAPFTWSRVWSKPDAATPGFASEISAYDAGTRTLWTVGGNGLVVRSLATGDVVRTENLTRFGTVNSIAIRDGVAALSFAAPVATNPGNVQFFSTTLPAAPGALSSLGGVTVGALPDMVIWTPDGTRLLTANEAERGPVVTPPAARIDPVGSVSIIQFNATSPSASTVSTADFSGFTATQLQAAGVRLDLRDGRTPQQDLEPEYIAIAKDGKTAYVTLQENNAIGVLDLQTNTFTQVAGLGTKDFSQLVNAIDPSDQDGTVSFRQVQVRGLYQPDAIAAFTSGGKTYLITANEGDARGDDTDAARLRAFTAGPAGSLVANGTTTPVLLDPTLAASLRDNPNLGRLNVSVIDGLSTDGKTLQKITTFGGRSFSIWDDKGNLVYDSGNLLETLLRARPDLAALYDDGRSDDKGLEPEGVTVIEVGGRTLAFVGLERTSAGTAGLVAVVDVADPAAPTVIDYISQPGMFRAEGVLAFEDAGQLYLKVAFEGDGPSVPGGSALYAVPAPGSLALLGLAGLALAAARRRRG
jgi:DNA-binding beta-propeller fold protein YncE